MQLQITLQKAIIDEFNRLESENQKAKVRVKDDLLFIVNNHRQQGFLLMDYKETVPHGQWVASFKTAFGKHNASVIFDVDYNTGRRYIQIAKRYPNTITDPREASLAIVEMWHPERELNNGHGIQQLHDHNFFADFNRKIMGVMDVWEKEMKNNPMSQWTRQTAEQFVYELADPIERINHIYEQAKCIATTAA